MRKNIHKPENNELERKTVNNLENEDEIDHNLN